MSIEIDAQTLHSAASDTQIHHVPCEIEQNGEANVEQYFASAQRTHKGEHGLDTVFTSSSIRGRPVIGTKVQVPKDYSLVVLKELAKPFNEDDERCFRATHKVEEYTHWNLDLEPSSNDKAHQARQWLEIATVLHSPVDDVDSQASTVSR